MADTEVRTQLYLPAKLHRALKRAAKQRGVSMAELLREAARDAVRRQAVAASDPLEGLIGAVSEEASDVAEGHDRHLYGLARDDT
jgi:hypothetical protein